MRRRVLYVIGGGEPGGRELQLAKLAPRMAASGWDVGVIFLVGGGPVQETVAAAGIRNWVGRPPGPTSQSRLVRPLKSARFLGGLALGIRRRIAEFAPDIVHAMLPSPVLLSVPATFGTRSASVAGIYGFMTEPTAARQRAYGYALRHADAITCNAPHLAADIGAQFGIPAERFTVLPNGLDVPEWSADPVGPESAPPTAVVVANFHPYKGYDILIEAASRMRVPARFRLCGDGATRDDAIALAQRLGVSDRVEFVTPPADVPAELRAAQFAVHPSLTEGLSNAILEELGAGLPVVATDVGGNATLVDDEVNGLLVAPGNPHALARAMDQLAADPGLRTRLAAAAKAKAEAFSWPECVRRHEDLYAEAIVARGR